MICGPVAEQSAWVAELEGDPTAVQLTAAGSVFIHIIVSRFECCRGADIAACPGVGLQSSPPLSCCVLVSPACRVCQCCWILCTSTASAAARLLPILPLPPSASSTSYIFFQALASSLRLDGQILNYMSALPTLLAALKCMCNTQILPLLLEAASQLSVASVQPLPALLALAFGFADLSPICRPMPMRIAYLSTVWWRWLGC